MSHVQHKFRSFLFSFQENLFVKLSIFRFILVSTWIKQERNILIDIFILKKNQSPRTSLLAFFVGLFSIFENTISSHVTLRYQNHLMLKGKYLSPFTQPTITRQQLFELTDIEYDEMNILLLELYVYGTVVLL